MDKLDIRGGNKKVAPVDAEKGEVLRGNREVTTRLGGS